MNIPCKAHKDFQVNSSGGDDMYLRFLLIRFTSMIWEIRSGIVRTVPRKNGRAVRQQMSATLVRALQGHSAMTFWNTPRSEWMGKFNAEHRCYEVQKALAFTRNSCRAFRASRRSYLKFIPSGGLKVRGAVWWNVCVTWLDLLCICGQSPAMHCDGNAGPAVESNCVRWVLGPN